MAPQYRDIYNDLSNILGELYDPREGATIARYLMEDVFGSTFWNEDLVTNEHQEQLLSIKSRLLAYEPWQYIGGVADFYGFKFKVNASVLIPRPETEELVAIALDTIKAAGLKSVLDIGTGSGIIPITIAKKSVLADVYGLDLSNAALEVSQQNNALLGTTVRWIEADFLNDSCWSNLPKVDLVVSNPPYIHSDEKASMDANVINFEPHMALFVNHDVMEFYDALSAFVMTYQDDGCHLIVEIHESHGQRVVDSFLSAGLQDIELIRDMQGKDRIVVAKKGD